MFQYLLEERALNCGPGETNPFDKHDLVESDDGPGLDELVLETTGVDLNPKVQLVFPEETSNCFSVYCCYRAQRSNPLGSMVLYVTFLRDLSP